MEGQNQDTSCKIRIPNRVLLVVYYTSDKDKSLEYFCPNEDCDDPWVFISNVFWFLRSCKVTLLKCVTNMFLLQGWVWSLSTNLEDQVISCGWDNMIFKWSFRESEMVQDLRINCKTACLCSTYVGDIVSIGSFDRKVKTFDLRTPNKQVEQV